MPRNHSAGNYTLPASAFARSGCYPKPDPSGAIASNRPSPGTSDVTTRFHPTWRRLLLCCSLLCASLSSTLLQADDNIRPFTAATMEQLKQEYAGQGFILSLWSVTCAPCREDLALLSELRAAHPDLPLVLVSTDAIQDKEDAFWVLEDYDLQDMESWMFADSFAEPLRHSIDPAWYGELPRSYFFDSTHAFTAHSGVLQHELLLMNMESLLREGPRLPAGEAHQHQP